MRRMVHLSIGVLISIGSIGAEALAQQNPEPGSGFATWDYKKGAWSDGSVSRAPEAQPTDMSTEAGIRARADRIFPMVSQTRQRELWIANRVFEHMDRQRGRSLSIRINR